MSPKQNRVQVRLPIDYEALALAFIEIGREWWSGCPTAQQLSEDIPSRIADVQSRPGPRNCANSGGIDVEWKDKKVVVLLEGKLAERYFANCKPCSVCGTTMPEAIKACYDAACPFTGHP